MHGKKAVNGHHMSMDQYHWISYVSALVSLDRSLNQYPEEVDSDSFEELNG